MVDALCVCSYLLIFIWFSFAVTCAVYILIFRFTNPLIFFGFFSLFSFSIVALGILFSTLFNDPGIGSLVSVFVLLAGIFTPNALTVLSKGLRLGLSLFSPFCFYWAMDVIALYEAAGIGIDFENFSGAKSSGNDAVS